MAIDNKSVSELLKERLAIVFGRKVQSTERQIKAPKPAGALE